MALRTELRAFLRDEDGATSIEYALIISLIAMVIMGSVTYLGVSLNELYEDAAGAFEDA